jgi:hypothetical protein
VKDWGKLQQKWEKRSLPVTLCLSNDSTLKGQVLFRNDSVLVLWADEHTFFNPLQADRYLRVFDPDSVQKIMVREHFSFTDEESGIYWNTLAGFLNGFLFMNASGYTYYYSPVLIFSAAGFGLGCVVDLIKVAADNAREKREAKDLNELPKRIQKKYSFFGDIQPESVSEMISLSDSSVETDMPFEDLLAVSPQAGRWFRTPHFSLCAQAGPYFWKYREEQDRSISISAAYTFSGRYTIRYMYRGFSEYYVDGILTGNTLSLENIHRTGNALFFNYAILPADRFLSNRFEISAGAGVSINKITYIFDKYDYFSNMQTWLTNANGRENKVGLNIMANTDFYLSKYLSLSLSAEKSFLMPFKSPEQQVWNPRTAEFITFEPEEYKLSSFDLLFGLRIHF